ncbi:hypothetical protein AAEX28_15325 [Lentisphaerota bacterium WC36G]|nr:hypothetical protein LJT99_02095 [Lentisphaerae bacterium WC36]
MKYLMKVYLAFITLLLTCSMFAKTATVRLYGVANEKDVKLLWLINGWPENTVGFKVKRRLVGSINWKPLNSTAIYPEISFSRDWQASGLSEDEADQYQNYLQQKLDTKNLKLVSKEDFAKMLAKSGMRSGDRIRLIGDFKLSVILGFGYIDHTFDKNNNYEYGLFSVDKDNLEAEKPLGTYKSEVIDKESLLLKVNNLKVGPFYSELVLDWTYSAELYKRFNLLGFNIYRRKSPNHQWKLIYPKLTVPTKKGFKNFKFYDKNISLKESYQYGIAANSVFGGDYIKTIVTYNPKYYEKGIGVKIDNVTQIKNSNKMVIDASTDIKNLDLIKSCYIERWLGDEEKIVYRSSTLKDGKLHFVDSIPLRETCSLSYKVITILHNGKKLYSSSKIVNYIKPVKLIGKVKNLKVVKHFKDGHFHLKLSWDKVAKAKGYIFYRGYNNESPCYESSLPLIKENLFKYEEPIESGGVFKYGIEALDKDGIGSGVNYVTVKLPTIYIDGFENLKINLTKNGNFLFCWDYYLDKESDMNSIKAFQLYFNGEKYKKLINPKTRSIIIKNNTTLSDKRYHKYRFGIKAITPYVASDIKSINKGFSLDELVDKRIPKIDYINAEKIETKGKKYIEIKWHEIKDLEKKNLCGYRLQVARYKENVNSYSYLSWKDVTHGYDESKATSYKYKIPDDFKQGILFFRIQAVRKKLIKNSNGDPRVYKYGPWEQEDVTIYE